MIFGAILAGGVGSRMNMADMPKQFLQLGNKPIIVHTVEKFLLSNKIDVIYVGVHPDWVSHTNDLIKTHIGTSERIVVVPGGSDRNGTIFNIIDDIETNYGESEEHIIVTHDSVRPFVSIKMIDDNVAAAIKYGAVDTAVGAVDTIVVSQDGLTISDIPDRSKIYQGQTPQSFSINLLKKLYNELSAEEKNQLTDACKICVVKNYPVYIVEGSSSNLKITTVSDLKIAQAMVGGKISD